MRRFPILSLAAAALGAALAGIPAAAAPQSCVFTQAEFEAAAGGPSYSPPESVDLAGGTGSACAYDQGQVILYAGPNGPAAWEQMLAGFGVDPVKTPAEGLGEGAYWFPYQAPSTYQDSGVFVVFFKGDHTSVVTVYSKDGVPPESALEPALALARTMYGKLP